MRLTILSSLFVVAFGSPTPAGSYAECEYNNLTSLYTLTAYAPGNPVYNGLKVNNFNLFQERVAQYCPAIVEETSDCPNGTDMVFIGNMSPYSSVPGGQDTYVAADGRLQVTVQHSHTFPPGSFPSWIGWTWQALPVHQAPVVYGCPVENPLYNCTSPTGYFQFKAPNATHSGILACPDPYNTNGTRLYGVTPSFNLTGCIPLLGLGTHPYVGPSPVWSYY